MHKVGALVLVAWAAFSGAALAEDIALGAPGQGGGVHADTSKKIDGRATFLLMPLGKGNGHDNLALAYGAGVSLGYTVFRGLSVGVAPQVLFNIKRQDNPRRQYDLMARIAYTLPVVAKLSVYGEILPGYSIIAPSKGDSARGFVVAVGAGAAMDLTDHIFANAGVGYQYGSQSLLIEGTRYYERDSFLRVAVGGGTKF